MKPNSSVITLAIVLGALFALVGYGGRGFHPLMSFVMMTGFVIGVGAVVIGINSFLSDFKQRRFRGKQGQ